jgi:hypothetical protein
MYLAGILALCALLYVTAAGGMGSGSSFFAPQDAQTTQSQPTPAEQAPPPAKAGPDHSNPGTAKPADQPSTSKSQTAPPKHPAAKKPPATKKKKPADPGVQDPNKTVVRHGSTAEPTTQLTPGITEEQAARQRETTNQLLSSTDAALQKLDPQQLSSDQKETVAQIRKFMQQAKAADAEGDPQRSYKLALKAHLLTDALEKP